MVGAGLTAGEGGRGAVLLGWKAESLIFCWGWEMDEEGLVDGEGGVGGAEAAGVGAFGDDLGDSLGAQSIAPKLPFCTAVASPLAPCLVSSPAPSFPTSIENRLTCLPTVPLRTGTIRDGAEGEAGGC